MNILLCTPYTGKDEEDVRDNILFTLEVAQFLIKEGHRTLFTHCAFPPHQDTEAIRHEIGLLDAVDAVVFASKGLFQRLGIGENISQGALGMLVFAQRRGLPCYLFASAPGAMGRPVCGGRLLPIPPHYFLGTLNYTQIFEGEHEKTEAPQL